MEKSIFCAERNHWKENCISSSIHILYGERNHWKENYISSFIPIPREFSIYSFLHLVFKINQICWHRPPSTILLLDNLVSSRSSWSCFLLFYKFGRYFFPFQISIFLSYHQLDKYQILITQKLYRFVCFFGTHSSQLSGHKNF